MHGHEQNPLCLNFGLAFLVSIAVASLAGCGAPLATAPSSSPVTGGSAQPHIVSAPVLGYAWDSKAQTLRQIDGVPGAAKVNTAGDTGQGFALAVAAETHDYALLLDNKGALYLAALPGGTPALISAGPWSGAVISVSGEYAVIYSTSGPAPELISGLPQQPTFKKLALPATNIRGAAVSNTGTALLAADSTNSIAIFTVPQNGAAIQAMTMGQMGGMAFVPTNDSAIVSDASSGTVTLISNASTSPAASAINNGKLNQSIGIDVSADGRWAVVANSTGAVIRIDLSGQTASATATCNCTPTTVATLSGSAFRLTDAGSSIGWIVDAGGTTPRILFVPALPSQKAIGGGQ